MSFYNEGAENASAGSRATTEEEADALISLL